MISKQTSIIENLKIFLSQGPQEVKHIVEHCHKKDIGSRRSLFKARNAMNLLTVEIDGKAYWQLPVEPPKPIITEVKPTVNSKFGMDKVNSVMKALPKLNKWGKPMTENDLYAEQYGPFDSLEELESHRKRKEREDRLGY
jgi:hypothetical protein